MGFFSWITSDTKKPINNRFSPRPCFTVYLLDDKGNVWREDAYEGYGVFGGKDFYALVDEMNTGDGDRDVGINLEDQAGRTPGIRLPKLVEHIPGDIENLASYWASLPNSEDDPDQGYW